MKDWKLLIKRDVPEPRPAEKIKEIVFDNGDPEHGYVRSLKLSRGATGSYFFYYERSIGLREELKTTVGGDLGVAPRNLRKFAEAIIEMLDQEG